MQPGMSTTDTILADEYTVVIYIYAFISETIVCLCGAQKPSKWQWMYRGNFSIENAQITAVHNLSLHATLKHT